jgi:glutathione synthase/RimK-type ligase-like ATP-grasp enzyme
MVKALFVVEKPELWPYEIPGADVALATRYLAGAPYENGAYNKVYNLCDSGRYQGQGFYVSMLAEARGHQPVPNLRTIEDLGSEPVLELLAQEMEPLVEQLGAVPDKGDTLEVDAYFGADPTGRYEALARRLFALVRAPLLRTRFRFAEGRGKLESVQALALADIPDDRRWFLSLAATQVVAGARKVRRPEAEGGPAIAILHDGGSADAPSNPEALHRFVGAATRLGMRASIIGKDSLDRLENFHALFIRDTTNLNHHTYDFSRRAAALGLVVIDDPESILQCNNKVYLHELLTRHKLPMPRSLLVHRENVGQIVPTVGLPCILKQPDSAFSLGVSKVDTPEQLLQTVESLLAKSELVIAQEFLPTQFDWRIGIFDRRPLFACRYFMAPNHWQVIKRDRGGRTEGATAAVPLGEVPEAVMKAALDAANLIGSGLYGVDVKQVGQTCYVIEVNDNPNIDAGNEDSFLGDALYEEVMSVFKRRIGERVPVSPSQPALVRASAVSVQGIA